LSIDPKFLPLLQKKEHFSQKPQKISECFVRLTREYTDGETNIRSKSFLIVSFSGFTGMPSVYSRARHPSETARWRLLR